jgi:hypothetical protein
VFEFLEEKQFNEMLEETEFDNFLVFANVFTCDETKKTEVKHLVFCELANTNSYFEI